MTVLIAITDEAGETQQCDARCYNARYKRCKCVCSGENHGKGLAQAEENTRSRDWSDAVTTVTGGPAPRIRRGTAVAMTPLFALATVRPEGTSMSTQQPADPGDVWYHGRRNPEQAGPSPVMIETAAGELLGTLAFEGRKSPTGMSWGFLGSGAAECARAILVGALGAEGNCHECNGTGKFVWDERAAAAAPPEPFDPARRYGSRYQVDSCCGEHCERGTQITPRVYQAFKEQFVARWGAEWRMSRQEILDWVRPRLEAS